LGDAYGVKSHPKSKSHLMVIATKGATNPGKDGTKSTVLVNITEGEASPILKSSVAAEKDIADITPDIQTFLSNISQLLVGVIANMANNNKANPVNIYA
jgi:hypothetical protein